MSNVKAISFETTLGEIGVFEKSYTFSRAVEGKGEVKQIHYGDIHTKLPNVINDASVLPTITQQDDFQFVNYGDIIIADASEDYKDLGKAVCYLDKNEKKVISGLHTHRFNIDKDKVIPEYLINLFQTSRYQKFVWKMGTGISVLGLSKSNLSKYPVTLPDIKTQKKIGALFEGFNKKIQLQKEKIDLLKEQKKGYMQKIFKQKIRFKDNGGDYPSWEIKELNRVSEINPKSPNLNDEFYYIDLESVKNGVLSKVKVVSKEDAPSRAQRVVQKDDILYQTVRPYQKNNYYVLENNSTQTVASTGYAQIRVKKGLNSIYLYQYLQTSEFTNLVLKSCTGTSYPAINSNDLGSLTIKIPSLKEQIKIADCLSKLDEKIQLEQQKLEDLRQQRKGFMQQMFI
ncbi:restriction endonuclease subunit S [Bacillus toyonensis]|nr:restriction endonuclease subunit S [Bacillus toyonensis]